MKIAFVTTQSIAGSTIIGRAMPLARQFAKNHDVHVLIYKSTPATSQLKQVADHSATTIHFEYTGYEPFVRTSTGKQRLKGIRLAIRMLGNALHTGTKLLQIQPDIIIIMKPLPANVLAVTLYRLSKKPQHIILDVDDFELAANTLTSLLQRAAIHWSERTGARIAGTIVAASPFLGDHFEQLTGNKKRVVLIPTGIDAVVISVAHEAPPAQHLCYIGSVSIASGHRVDLLPEILQQLHATHPQVKLTISGSGDDCEQLKNAFQERDLSRQVSWQGRFELYEIPHLVQKTSILIDPIDASITNRAKSSFRTLLGAVAGIPVVTSNVGIRPYFLPPQLHDRFFAIPGDAKSYAEKIHSLLKRPLNLQEQQSMQNHARQYTWDNLAQKYAQLLHS